MAQMSINTDVVGSAVNQISVRVADIETRTNKFLNLVTEKNSETSNRWSLLKTLQDKLAVETENVKRIIAAEDDIKADLNRYAEAAAEVDDDSELG